MMFGLVCFVNIFHVRRLLEKSSYQTLAWKDCKKLEGWGWETGDLQFGQGVASAQDYNKLGNYKGPIGDRRFHGAAGIISDQRVVHPWLTKPSPIPII